MKKTNKKGVQLTMSTLIVAVILLIVLAVVVYIFVQRSGVFAKSLEGPACQERGIEGKEAKCKISGQQCPEGTYQIYARGCRPEGGQGDLKEDVGPCCVPVRSLGEK